MPEPVSTRRHFISPKEHGMNQHSPNDRKQNTSKSKQRTQQDSRRTQNAHDDKSKQQHSGGPGPHEHGRTGSDKA
jgi:hypothetical protein